MTPYVINEISTLQKELIATNEGAVVLSLFELLYRIQLQINGTIPWTIIEGYYSNLESQSISSEKVVLTEEGVFSS